MEDSVRLSVAIGTGWSIQGIRFGGVGLLLRLHDRGA